MKQDLAEAAVFITNGVKTFLENGLPLGPIRLYYDQVDADLVSIANDQLPSIIINELYGIHKNDFATMESDISTGIDLQILKGFESLKARDKFYTSVASALLMVYLAPTIKITFGQAAKRVEDRYMAWKQKNQN